MTESTIWGRESARPKNTMEIEDPIGWMVGKECTAVIGCKEGSDTLALEFAKEGARIVFWHSQDCCESVEIVDVCGDASDLVGMICEASEEENAKGPPPEPWESDTSRTWTFYRFATHRGTVVVRWLGQSNGYYSERVSYRAERMEP